MIREPRTWVTPTEARRAALRRACGQSWRQIGRAMHIDHSALSRNQRVAAEFALLHTHHPVSRPGELG